MTRLRGIVAVIGTVIACSAVTVSVTSAPAGAFSGCADVTVVVDLTHWGQGVQRGCADNPATGVDALHQAGFSTAGDVPDGANFVCRIAGKPSASEETCEHTPPGNAYWRYSKTRDSRWVPSSSGANYPSSKPAPHSVEGWAFGAGLAPSVTPTEAVTPDAPPPTNPPPSGGGGGNSGGGGTPLHPTGGTTAGGNTGGTGPKIGDAVAATPKGGEVVVGGTTTTTTKATAAKAKAKAAAAKKKAKNKTTRTTAPDAVRVIDRAASSKPASSDSGSPLPAIIALVLIVAAVTGGVFYARARRQRVS